MVLKNEILVGSKGYTLWKVTEVMAIICGLTLWGLKLNYSQHMCKPKLFFNVMCLITAIVMGFSSSLEGSIW